jgi:hypothetical protein
MDEDCGWSACLVELESSTRLEAPWVLSPSLARTIRLGEGRREQSNARKTIRQYCLYSPRIHVENCRPARKLSVFFGIKKYNKIHKEIIKGPIDFSDTSPHAEALDHVVPHTQARRSPSS